MHETSHLHMGALKSCTGYRHWKELAKSCYLISVYLIMPQAHEEMHDLNNVIQINGAGQIRLCELHDDNIPGKIRCFGLIQPKSLLQRLTGIWRWMPNVSSVILQ